MPYKDKIKRKELGLCRECSNESLEGYIRCDKCLWLLKIRSKRVRDRRKREGRCYKCGKKLIEGERNICYACRTISHSKLYLGNMKLLKGILKYANTNS